MSWNFYNPAFLWMGRFTISLSGREARPDRGAGGGRDPRRGVPAHTLLHRAHRPAHRHRDPREPGGGDQGTRVTPISQLCTGRMSLFIVVQNGMK